MISFLIPTYNFNCAKLVRSIWKQAEALRTDKETDFDFEIIVSDDASEEKEILEALDADIATLPRCRLLRQQHRLGRAANRNALTDESHFPWKVFIDADADIYTTDFVRCFWEARHKADVVCGSLLPAEPEKGCELRYRYELHASQTMTAERRNKVPHSRFTAFNVMLSEKAVGKVRFDENCKDYGHEDTLLGIALQKAGLSVIHIDNPLVHAGLDSNEAFLNKTEEALVSLIRLPQLTKVVGSSHIYSIFQRFCMAWILRMSSPIFCPLLRRNLLGKHPSLLLFDCYKLLFYASLKGNITRKEI